MIPVEQRVEVIYQYLHQALQPAHLEVIDDSHLHVGHAGHGGAGHFTVNIVAEQFAHKSLIERHRMVYAVLQPLMPDTIHALCINAVSVSSSMSKAFYEDVPSRGDP
jgi:BolA protein